MELFKLFGSIMVDNKKANQSIQKTDSLASKLSKGLGKGVKTAAKWGAGLAAGAAAGGTALFGVAKKAADTGDRIDKMSQKMSLSRKGFQEWEYVLSQNGMEIESLRGGMKKLTKSLDDAKTGSKGAVEAFGRIGLSVDEIKNMNPEQAFEATVKALQSMPEGAEKAALANELLGKSGAELMPLLNGSAESVERLKQQARDMGLVLSDEAVDASAKFTDTLDDIKRSLGAIVSKIGVSVMPIMQKALDWVMAHMPEIQAVMSTVFKTIKKVVETVVDVFNKYLLPVFQSIYDWVQENWPTIKQIISDAMDGAKLALDKLIEVGGKVVDAMQPIFDFFKDVVIYVTNFKDETNLTIPVLAGLTAGFVAFKTAMTISTLIDSVKKSLLAFKTATEGQTVAQGLLNAVMNMNPFVKIAILIGALVTAGVMLYKNWDTVVAKAKALMGKLGVIWDGIKVKVSEVWDGVKSKISNVVNGIKNTVTNVFNGLKTTVTNIWNGIKLAIMTPINAAKNVVRNAINSIKNMFNFKFKWPKLPMPHFSISGSMNPLKWLKEGVPKISVDWYAKGGIFSKPTLFDTASGIKGVGEKGPEAVAPISKLQQMLDWNSTDTSNIESKLDKIIDILSLILGKDLSIYLEGKKMSKELAPLINRELEVIKQRG